MPHPGHSLKSMNSRVLRYLAGSRLEPRRPHSAVTAVQPVQRLYALYARRNRWHRRPAPRAGCPALGQPLYPLIVGNRTAVEQARGNVAAGVTVVLQPFRIVTPSLRAQPRGQDRRPTSPRACRNGTLALAWLRRRRATGLRRPRLIPQNDPPVAAGARRIKLLIRKASRLLAVQFAFTDRCRLAVQECNGHTRQIRRSRLHRREKQSCADGQERSNNLHVHHFPRPGPSSRSRALHCYLSRSLKSKARDMPSQEGRGGSSAAAWLRHRLRLRLRAVRNSA